MSISRAERLAALERERAQYRSSSCLSDSTPKVKSNGQGQRFTLASDAFSKSVEKEERAVLKALSSLTK